MVSATTACCLMMKMVLSSHRVVLRPSLSMLVKSLARSRLLRTVSMALAFTTSHLSWPHSIRVSLIQMVQDYLSHLSRLISQLSSKLTALSRLLRCCRVATLLSITSWTWTKRFTNKLEGDYREKETKSPKSSSKIKTMAIATMK